MSTRRRMQNVRFSTVEELFDFLPENQLDILLPLRDIIVETIPDVTEKLSYQVPYYRRHANICFLWPGAVSWGNTTYEGVRFGFTTGYLLDDPDGFLDKGDRKQVYWHDFLSPGEIDQHVIETLLVQAVEVDEQMHVVKRSRRRG